MRWWLGLAFAGVAALTAIAVVWVLNTRSVHAFHDYAESLAVGRSLVAVEALKHDTTIAAVRRDAVAVSRERRVRLYVFDAHGKPITSLVSRDVSWSHVPNGDAAKAAALAGTRYLQGRPDGSNFVVGFPSPATSPRWRE